MFTICSHIKGHSGNNFDQRQVASGIQMSFANGNTISIQFGFGNYCENRNESKETCKDAEIAIWNSANVWHTFEGDQVKGYCTTDEVAEWIQFAASNVIG